MRSSCNTGERIDTSFSDNPRTDRQVGRAITPITTNSAERHLTLVLVGGFCGLRFGEAVALEIEDLDLLRKSLLISSTLVEVNGTINKADTKTPSSRRRVALPSFLVEELAAHISEWPNEDGRVFGAPDGGPVSRTNWRRRFWLPALDKSIGGYLRFHDLRHSHAAQLIAQGEHVKVIADRLGHASPMVTLTTYAHLFDGLDRDAADLLDDAWTRSVTDPRRTQTRSWDTSRVHITARNSR